jgi:hypothetical protein
MIQPGVPFYVQKPRGDYSLKNIVMPCFISVICPKHSGHFEHLVNFVTVDQFEQDMKV